MSVPILLYHHIAPPPPRGTPARSNYVTPTNFARQMRWLKRLGIQGLSLEQAMPYITGVRRGRVAVITFDDGFMSVFDNAMPILAHYGFSATCFFVADKIGADNDWNKPQAQRAPLMGKEEIRQFTLGGHEVASHTLTHPHLTRLTERQAQYEISQSKQKLEALTGQDVSSFAYPYGDENETLRQQVWAAGYHHAVSTIKGRADLRGQVDGTGQMTMEKFALPRFSIRRNDTIGHFLLKCLFRR